MGHKDALGHKIEDAALAHLGESGSFTTQEIFDAITGHDRQFRRLYNKLNKEFGEFGIAYAYEAYIGKRVHDYARRTDKRGDRIFVGIKVGRTARYVMRMDATPEQLRQAGYATLAKAFDILKKGMEHVVGSNVMDYEGVGSLAEYGDDYETVNERIKSEANHMANVVRIGLHASTQSAQGVQNGVRGIGPGNGQSIVGSQPVSSNP